MFKKLIDRFVNWLSINDSDAYTRILLSKQNLGLESFKNVWDPKKFNWMDSYLLPFHFPKYFDIWYDDKYYFDDSGLAIESLIRFCGEDFDKWFKPETFRWDAHVGYLCTSNIPFDKWFKPGYLRPYSNIVDSDIMGISGFYQVLRDNPDEYIEWVIKNIDKDKQLTYLNYMNHNVFANDGVMQPGV